MSAPTSPRWILGLLSCVAACGYQQATPSYRTIDARFGRLGGSGALPDQAKLCKSWDGVVMRDPWAVTHVSFPETNPNVACFTKVSHDGRSVRASPAPPGCGYPDDAARARLSTLAAGVDRASAPSTLFPCSLTDAQRAAAARQNARVLRALAASGGASYPYAAVMVPGHGTAEQDESAVAGYLPGDACRALHDGDLQRLGAMPIRSERAADAMRGGVAPVAIVSGGAVHSHVVEAFALMHLLVCREGIDASRVLVEPCAEHTHTNLRNSARWLSAMGARAAYLVTNDGIQSDYFQDDSAFEILLGSIDQRSLRDFGYVIGSWRQVSEGIDAGFWFTPYRFWAEPRDGLGSATCVDGP